MLESYHQVFFDSVRLIAQPFPCLWRREQPEDPWITLTQVYSSFLYLTLSTFCICAPPPTSPFYFPLNLVTSLIQEGSWKFYPHAWDSVFLIRYTLSVQQSPSPHGSEVSCPRAARGTVLLTNSSPPPPNMFPSHPASVIVPQAQSPTFSLRSWPKDGEAMPLLGMSVPWESNWPPRQGCDRLHYCNR